MNNTPRENPDPIPMTWTVSPKQKAWVDGFLSGFNDEEMPPDVADLPVEVVKGFQAGVAMKGAHDAPVGLRLLALLQEQGMLL